MLNLSEQEVKVIVNQYQEYKRLEDTILEILDEIQKLRLSGSKRQVRERLRNLASTKTSVFRFIAFAINLRDEYEKAIEPHNEAQEIIEAAEFLAQRYSDLSRSVVAVYLEAFNSRINPITSYDYEIGYREELLEPMVYFESTTGEVDLFETRVSSSIGLYLSRSILEAVVDSTNAAADEGLPVEKEERERLKDISQEIQEYAQQIEEAVDRIPAPDQENGN